MDELVASRQASSELINHKNARAWERLGRFCMARPGSSQESELTGKRAQSSQAMAKPVSSELASHGRVCQLRARMPCKKIKKPPVIYLIYRKRCVVRSDFEIVKRSLEISAFPVEK